MKWQLYQAASAGQDFTTREFSNNIDAVYVHNMSFKTPGQNYYRLQEMLNDMYSVTQGARHNL